MMYLLFGDNYWFGGKGADGFLGRFESVNEAREATVTLGFEWAHIATLEQNGRMVIRMEFRAKTGWQRCHKTRPTPATMARLVPGEMD